MDKCRFDNSVSTPEYPYRRNVKPSDHVHPSGSHCQAPGHLNETVRYLKQDPSLTHPLNARIPMLGFFHPLDMLRVWASRTALRQSRLSATFLCTAGATTAAAVHIRSAEKRWDNASLTWQSLEVCKVGPQAPVGPCARWILEPLNTILNPSRKP